MPSPSRSSNRNRSPRSRSRSRSPASYRSQRQDLSPRRSRSPGSRRNRRRDASPRRSRSRSPVPHRNQGRGTSPRRRRNRSPRERRTKYDWGRPEDREREEKEETPIKKEEPNFGLSGKLAAETNTYKGVELKYNEPPEAAKPKQKWRLYVFKGSEQIELLHLHRQSSFLVGRDRVVVDIPVDHPSCSKQHAVVQFRRVTEESDIGLPREVIKPFVIDLDSTNGTFLNGNQIPATRFVELRVKDVLKFGHSTREYVLLHSEASN
ncbi:hypothetical protein DFQ28_005129 [Apophysomyces sp. BC1034]|nr:hypothetical protein DFQ30_004991 [Apophysomyces sp. BC1015]KAG0178004.1 hypothetical protein DFQ29_004050 [Apophysomyces sp. BC1021]KAG0188293.1 hypothetical protein DFQ28_005129 [Apophysomyces sp. BC1034]